VTGRLDRASLDALNFLLADVRGALGPARKRRARF
jgi:hypothetical protein